MSFRKLLLVAAVPFGFVLAANFAVAQPAPAAATQKVAQPATPAPNDPNKAFFPDQTHIPIIFGADIPWKGREGREQTYNVMGDPRQPGPYIQLLKWWPGNFSKPHFHAKVRYITVLSGTWWVSSSAHYDPNTTYPLPAGTLVQDMPQTVHWDGAKDTPVVLEIVGDGPVPNINVDENGQPTGKNSF